MAKKSIDIFYFSVSIKCGRSYLSMSLDLDS